MESSRLSFVTRSAAAKDWPRNMFGRGRLARLRLTPGTNCPPKPSGSSPVAPAPQLRYWFGATGERLSIYGWHKGNAEGRTHTVGQFDPNPFGLYDLNGNVSEWCQDGWQLAYYAQFEQQTAVDPTGPIIGILLSHLPRRQLSLPTFQ